MSNEFKSFNILLKFSLCIYFNNQDSDRAIMQIAWKQQFIGHASFLVTPPRHDEPQGQEGDLKKKTKN